MTTKKTKDTISSVGDGIIFASAMITLVLFGVVVGFLIGKTVGYNQGAEEVINYAKTILSY